jgi:hypothetical protein
MLAFDRRKHVLLVRFSGVFSSEDVARLDRAAISLIAQEGPADAIVDFSPIEAWAFPMTKLVQRAQQPAISKDRRRVYVIARPEFADAMLTFATEQRLAGTDTPSIVSTFDDALRELNLIAPNFEVIEQS